MDSKKFFFHKIRITILILFCLNCKSQNRSNVWMLGRYIDEPQSGINFNGGTADTFSVFRPMTFLFTNASICDTDGVLLFYTNGQYIANRNHDTLYNSNNFNPGYATDFFYLYGLGFDQGAIILPKPSSKSKYEVFYITCDDALTDCEPLHLSFSEVDMNLDVGLGGITETKNKYLIEDTLVLGRLTACKHANGRDWWLVSHEFKSNRYYMWLVQPDTILGPFSQSIGSVIKNDIGGSACFSPDGSRYAMINPIDSTLDILEFDRCSGGFDYAQTIKIPDKDWSLGSSFSPNSRFLYVCTFSNIYQFDVWQQNIGETMIKVASWDTAYLPFWTQFHQMQLAPDNKIYVATHDENNILHVIKNPNGLGVACEVVQNSFFLPQGNDAVPNFPNYDLGALKNTPCDSLSPPYTDSTITVHIFPNLTSNWLNIEYSSSADELQFKLFDVSGRLITEMSLSHYFLNRVINLTNFANGVYLYRVDDGKKIIQTGKVVKIN